MTGIEYFKSKLDKARTWFKSCHAYARCALKMLACVVAYLLLLQLVHILEDTAQTENQRRALLASTKQDVQMVGTKVAELGERVDGLSARVDKLNKELEESKRNTEVSRGGEIRRGYKLNVRSTAYTTAPDEGSGTGLAADGKPAIANHTFAVDPKVIPLGSRVFVPGIGWGVAHDTGGVINGNTLDVCVATKAEAYAWGVRNITVEVVPPNN